ncbi:MAG: bifunctional ADP-heptose synthase [Leptospiraceae bacterium]|nr:bifunctional ADP-heptose synthase [Leptospiraceae bacterium]
MIAVIGDLILDKYDYCSNRQNPESSAPCYTVEKTEYKPGGAGNVACNLVSLGSECLLVSVVGEDANAKLLEELLESFSIQVHLIKDKERSTIVKERVLSITDGRYHYRKDIEKKIYIDSSHVEEIIEMVHNVQGVLISDYNKGTISEKLMQELKKLGIPIIVDPKPNHKDFYKDVFLVKPNRAEVREMTSLQDDIEAAKSLSQELNANVLLTRSEDGIYYYSPKEEFLFPTISKKVFDVTGAGDTVIATFTHFYFKGYKIEDCVRLANKAGGVAIQYPGCYHVKEKDIL